jgi:hypothetical protein
VKVKVRKNKCGCEINFFYNFLTPKICFLFKLKLKFFRLRNDSNNPSAVFHVVARKGLTNHDRNLCIEHEKNRKESRTLRALQRASAQATSIAQAPLMFESREK